MKLSVDKEAEALYLRLDDSPVIHSEEVSPGVVLDYNESNDVVGVEMLRLSQRSSNLNLSPVIPATAKHVYEAGERSGVQLNLIDKQYPLRGDT